jgi:putative acetyltransferase
MILRSESTADHEAIDVIVDLAFEGPTESLLIRLIRSTDRFVPNLSIVATVDDAIVGHILLSYVDLVGESTTRVLSLAPLAVHPDHQRRGIGGALVREAIGRAEDRGEPLVMVEGHPGYYPRLGFEQGTPLGFEKPAHEIPDAAFMVRRLSAFNHQSGQIVYPPAFHETGAIGP